ncbi:serine/threonine-protein kinase [Streptomyces litchfieldiae]|uniref:non-specific serine/threonine protein kinase n=1 Tax=Streptomyces litchfieldiae TaxID=3075543 RepID=A0ABU2MYU3_9ACTN|nr:serine/threonine-protein kinase [Streptomyces sp. DSM 44938]MDT0345968.1 serine/threonine-protein kinase [Streptomyces sp. DSM 44938]
MERGGLIAGRYELLKRLGRGGMGEVWAARDRTLHRDVALKLLDLDGGVHPELPQRFEREAVAAAQINHPNVVALHDRGMHESMLFLVMEKVEGVTLSEYARAENPISMARVLDIASGICSALMAAHEAHIIHYDIKPSNVMLTSDGQVKVVDFGIAGFIQASFSVARSSQLAPAGTVEYGAPEQFLAERGDERSDLYALGGVLFTLLANRPPFTGHNGIALMRRKLDEEAPHLDSLRPDLPPAVTALVAELLQRRPDRRPQSARRVHERLQELRADLAPEKDGASGLRTTAAESSGPSIPAIDGTRQPSELPGSSFTISWTGEDRLSTYFDTRPRRVRAVSMTIAVTVLLAGFFITLALDPNEPFTSAEDGEADAWSAWSILFACTAGFTLLLLLVFLPMSYPAAKTAWSLQVGPRGIRTTSGFDRREYPWDIVRAFAIGEGGNSKSFLWSAALHIKFTGAEHPADSHPAGWPLPHRPEAFNDMVPVCVLGPMTDQQRTALREALARYGQGKDDADVWGA